MSLIYAENENYADRVDTIRSVLAYVSDSLCWMRHDMDVISPQGVEGLIAIILACEEGLKTPPQ